MQCKRRAANHYNFKSPSLSLFISLLQSTQRKEENKFFFPPLCFHYHPITIPSSSSSSHHNASPAAASLPQPILRRPPSRLPRPQRLPLPPTLPQAVQLRTRLLQVHLLLLLFPLSPRPRPDPRISRPRPNLRSQNPQLHGRQSRGQGLGSPPRFDFEHRVSPQHPRG